MTKLLQLFIHSLSFIGNKLSQMSEQEDYEMIFKLVLIGDSGVGKTNILLRQTKNDFNIDSKATVGVEFGTSKFHIEGYKVKVQIWDTAGQERYRSITNAYYKGAKGAFVVYDITKRSSFDSVDKWITDLRNKGEDGVTITLVGNKCDLEEERSVTKEEGQQKAKLHSIYYLTCFRYCLYGNFCTSSDKY